MRAPARAGRRRNAALAIAATAFGASLGLGPVTGLAQLPDLPETTDSTSGAPTSTEVTSTEATDTTLPTGSTTAPTTVAETTTTRPRSTTTTAKKPPKQSSSGTTPPSVAGVAGGFASSGPPAPAAAAPGLLRPFPVVRIAGRLTRRGARIRILSVRAPAGASVRVSCRGRGCPRPAGGPRVITAPGSTLRLRSLQRRLRAGTVLRVFVTRADAIGKYTRFTIRRGRPPARRDLCVVPGAVEPSRCPGSTA